MLLMVVWVAISGFAQGEGFSKYKESLKSTDVEISQPRGFKRVESVGSDLERLEVHPENPQTCIRHCSDIQLNLTA